jgi:hypothetical protein
MKDLFLDILNYNYINKVDHKRIGFNEWVF